MFPPACVEPAFMAMVGQVCISAMVGLVFIFTPHLNRATVF
jgi:hypothetical protein